VAAPRIDEAAVAALGGSSASELWILESVKERYARLLDAVFCFYWGAHETDISDSFAQFAAAASQVQSPFSVLSEVGV